MLRAFLFKLIIFLIINFSSLTSFAFEQIKILEISSSGKSIILDRGEIEGTKVGDIARLIIQSGEMNRPNLENLSYAEAVKVNSNYSFWKLLKNTKILKSKKNTYVLFALETHLMRGRSKFKTLYRQVLTNNKSDSFKRKKELLSNDTVSDGLVQNNTEYTSHDELLNSSSRQSHNLEVLDFQELEQSKGSLFLQEYDEDIKYINIDDIEQQIDYQLYGKAEEENIIDSTINNSIEKVNKEEGGLDSLYKNQKRDKNIKELQNNIITRTTYEEYIYQQKADSYISPKVARKMKSAGKFWSSDMTEKQLRKFFIKTGLEEEVHMQWLALENRLSHELTFDFSLGLLRNIDPDDENFQSTSKFVNINYNLYLLRISSIFKQWTLELGYGGGNGYIDFGGINLKSKDMTFNSTLNYYFFRSPTSVKRLSAYLGLGIRNGISELAAIGISRSYNYQYLAPLAQLGVKFRFLAGDEKSNHSNIGIGLLSKISAEYITLTATEDLFDNIDGKVQVTDVKLSLGMSVFF